MGDWRVAVAAQGLLLGGGYALWRWDRSRRGFDVSAKHGSAEELTASRVHGAAQDVIRATRSLGLVCCCSASSRAPSCRLMDLHFADDERLRLHLITKPWTRKAQQLGDSPEGVTITFHDPREGGENGYTALSGRVAELTEPIEREAVWKSSWSFFHQRATNAATIWEFTPTRCETVNHRRQVAPAWRPATLLRRPTGASGEDLWELEPISEPREVVGRGRAVPT